MAYTTINGVTYRTEEIPSYVFKEILTLKEASQYLGISKSSLYKHTMNRTIPHYKPSGKKCLFFKEELLNWVLTHKEI